MTVSEMTCNVSSGTLNLTHSLTLTRHSEAADFIINLEVAVLLRPTDWKILHWDRAHDIGFAVDQFVFKTI